MLSKIFFTMLLIFLSSIPCLGTCWVDIVSCNIEQLDWNSFRLKVDIDWGYDYEFPDYNPDFEPFYGSDGWGNLTGFAISPLLGTNQYNPSDVWIEPGYWATGPGGCLIDDFSYDFDLSYGLGDEPITLNYWAEVSYFQYEDNPYAPPESDIFLGTEYDWGTYQITPPPSAAALVPEPGSIVLLGFGLLAGAGMIRYRNKSQ